jgi:hypothetical protein
MGQAAAMAGVGLLGYAQYKQQGAAGKYNQAVQNRNAQIAEQEAAQLEKQLEFDLARFDQGQARKFEEANFSRIQGNIARQQARIAQLQTITQTGTSLLSMSGGSGGAK